MTLTKHQRFGRCVLLILISVFATLPSFSIAARSSHCDNMPSVSSMHDAVQSTDVLAATNSDCNQNTSDLSVNDCNGQTCQCSHLFIGTTLLFEPLSPAEHSANIRVVLKSDYISPSQFRPPRA